MLLLATLSASAVVQAEQQSFLRRDLKNKKNGNGNGNGANLRPTDGQPVFGPEELAQLQGQAEPDVSVTITRNNGDRTEVVNSGVFLVCVVQVDSFVHGCLSYLHSLF